MFEKRLLGVALVLAIPFAACNPIQKPRTPADLPAQEQFQAVLHQYPAVGAYLVETDAVLDILDGAYTLIDDLEFNPETAERAERFQKGQRVAECMRIGLRACPRVECSTPAQQCESEPRCEELRDEVRRLACQVREGYCRTSSSLKCQILLIED